MKKYLIALTLFATLPLLSCQERFSYQEVEEIEAKMTSKIKDKPIYLQTTSLQQSVFSNELNFLFAARDCYIWKDNEDLKEWYEDIYKRFFYKYAPQ
jgi:hypothetical protein